MRVFQASSLREITAVIFQAAGCCEAESKRIAESLVLSNLFGHDSHGVIRIAQYVRSLKRGEIKANQQITVVRENDVMAVVDGNLGFGQTVGHQAVSLGIEKARINGVSAVALRRSGHLGRIGEWAELAAKSGLVSIHFVNVPGSLLVAPFGGVDRRMSTNPIAIGIPRINNEPLVLDFATSATAMGKALLAYLNRRFLPEPCFVLPDGTTTADPTAMYGPYEPGVTPDTSRGEGAIRAFGGHKGSGLSFMCEILAGAISGGGTAGGKYSVVTNSMLSIYLAPAFFGSVDNFDAEVTGFVEFVRSSRPAEPGKSVKVPGMPEREMYEKRSREGIPLDDSVWSAILDSAEMCGVSRDRIEELATSR